MSRPRTIPDAEVFAAILRLIAEGGEKSVAFSSVARATGLSAPSLVQRYGALPDMVGAAMQFVWDQIDAQAEAAIGESPGSDKGMQTLLKLLSPAPAPAVLAISLRDAGLRERAKGWRQRIEAALAARCGDKETAAILFAAWQGQGMWDGISDKGFKVKDAIKRLS
jgi:AcrR family transcriptional regulator